MNTDYDRAPVERRVMRNKYGVIPVGTKVHFSVENPNTYIGPTVGILDHDGVDFVIRIEKRIMTINKGYDAYINTVRPVTHNVELTGRGPESRKNKTAL